MSAGLSTHRGKEEPEEVQMSEIIKNNSTSPTDNHEITTLSESHTETVVHVRHLTSSDDIDAEKDTETEKEEHHDNADGNDPFSAESLGPLMSVNQYSIRKTASQALMDVALLMANISQLRTLLHGGEKMEYYVILLVLVIVSLLFQLLFAVIIFLIWTRESEQHQRDDYLKGLKEAVGKSKGKLSPPIKDKLRNSILKRRSSYRGHRLNARFNYITMVLVFVITVINMFITGLGIKLEDSTDNNVETTHASS